MAKQSTGFFHKVYDVVATIPRGKVMTYGQIAARLGGFHSGRTVGFAMRAAPADRDLPCHRVVNIKGEMAPGYCFGGAERQRTILRKEGVKFLPDGRIDMKKSQLGAIAETTAARPQSHSVKPRTVAMERRSAGRTSSKS